MVYKRRLGWRKLPTEVFVCAKKSLKRGVSIPHPLHPTYATLSRYTFPHPVDVVRSEGSQTQLVVTYPWSQKRKHWQLAPPLCGMPDPGVHPKAVTQLSRKKLCTDPRRNSAPRQSDSSIGDPPFHFFKTAPRPRTKRLVTLLTKPDRRVRGLGGVTRFEPGSTMIQTKDLGFDDKIGPARWLICKVTCFQKFEGLNRPFSHLKGRWQILLYL